MRPLHAIWAWVQLSCTLAVGAFLLAIIGASSCHDCGMIGVLYIGMAVGLWWLYPTSAAAILIGSYLWRRSRHA